MNWGSSIEIYTSSYVKLDSQWNLLCHTGSSNPVLCDNLGGWFGVGGGRQVQEGDDIYMLMTDSCWYISEANTILWASLVPRAIEPTCQCRKHEMWVWPLSQEDPLEEGMATHSSILPRRIPMNRGAWWATVHKVAKSQTGLKQRSMHTVL